LIFFPLANTVSQNKYLLTKETQVGILVIFTAFSLSVMLSLVHTPGRLDLIITRSRSHLGHNVGL